MFQAFYVWIGKDTPGEILQQVFNVPSFTSIPENLVSRVVVLCKNEEGICLEMNL